MYEREKKTEKEREIVFVFQFVCECENKFGLKNLAKFVKLRRVDKLIVTITRDA